MRAGKNLARVVVLAAFGVLALGPMVAAQEMETVPEGPTMVEMNCIEQTHYIYDGFDRYADGTELFCVAIMSDGTTREFTTGPLIYT